VDVTIIAVPEPTITSLVGEGCAPVSVVFSTDQPVAGNCLWDLGNGQTSSQCGGDTVVYDVPGNYVVTLTVDVGSGCSGTVAGQAPIAVYAAPVASFTSAPEVITTNAPLVTFQNNSLGATSFLWSFGTFAASTEQEPVIEFPSALSDSYLVCLTAAVSPTCLDTACALVTIEPGAGLFVPTAFSPDGDGINDRFFPVMQGVDRRYHRFLILDRWGQILFDTADPDAQWSGNFPNGDPVPVGVYVWKITGKDAYSGERLDRTGSVTLVR
jgi:gliding motility-associated-like protein